MGRASLAATTPETIGPGRRRASRFRSCRALAAHPAFPGILYAGVEYAYGGGMFISPNGGVSWIEVGGSIRGQRVRAVAADPGEPLTILAAGGFSGVEMSTDNGTHWQHVTEGLPFADGSALVFDPSGNGIVYVATAAGVYKSFDHGAHWQPQGLADVGVQSLAVDLLEPQTLYAGSANGPVAVYKSETGGLSWTPADSGLTAPIRAIVADPAVPGTVYVAGNLGVFATIDGGDSWLPLGDAFEAPGVVTSLAIDFGGNILHAGTSARGVADYQLHFFDAPPSSLYRAPAETLARLDISAGCGAGNFCVAKSLTRAQASVWLLRAMHGGAYEPPPATGAVFPDVPADAFAAAWIEELATEGVTSGCGAEGFCPDAATTRAQLAVWLLRAKHGPAYAPPPATGTVFADVPIDAFAAAWIEELAAEGITRMRRRYFLSRRQGAAARRRDDPRQLAVWLLRAKHGPAYAPRPRPARSSATCRSDAFAAAWIEELAAEGITTGCGGGNFCPSESTTRGQAAALLVRTFELE